MQPIETERLILRSFRLEDLDDLYEMLSDAETVKYEPYLPMTMEEVRSNLDWRISTEEMIAVQRKSDGKMIGGIYLGAREFNALELGYVFNRSCWGMGYAAEGCQSIIQQAFSRGIHRIYAECDPNNPASWRLLERLGFQREAHLHQNIFFWKDEAGTPLWKDTFIYGRLS